MLTAGEGKHRVWLEKREELGGDLVYIDLLIENCRSLHDFL